MKRFELGNSAVRSPKAGFTLVEMVIAAFVLLVGLTAGMVLIVTAMANNNRSKMDSSATVLSQMTLEMIATVPANAVSNVTVVDCNPRRRSRRPAQWGAIDFTQSKIIGYSMTYYSCRASTGDRQALYDIRWNIKTLSPDARLVIVAAKPTGTDTHANFLAVPVTLKMIVGL